LSAQLSSFRSQLLGLQEQLLGLAETFLQRDPILPGCVYSLRRRCGKPNCRCVQGEFHLTEMLSYRGEGRPQSVTPRPGERETLRKLTQSYQRFRKARAQWTKLQKEVRHVLDEIESARIEEGKQQFQALLARRS